MASHNKFTKGFTRTPKFGVSLQSKRGFTLIELLVVIAIIGILSSIVLASLNTARDKGADAAIKGDLKSIVSQAAIVEDNTGSYATVCTDPNVVLALTAAGNVAASAIECNSDVTTWAAEAPLKIQNQFGGGSGQDYWCVDDGGVGKVEDDLLGAGTACL